MTDFSTHLQLQQFQQHIRRLMDIDEDAREADELLWQQMCGDSDEEESSTGRRPILHRIPNKNQNALAGHERFMSDYLNEDSVYNQADFERRFRVTKGVFIRLCNELQVKGLTPYFIQRAVCFSLNFNVYLHLILIQISSPRTAQGDLVSQRLKKLHVRCDS